MRRPVTGPSVNPQWAWPTASHNPFCPGAGPITGRESGKHGRAPSQVRSSARAPIGKSFLACGISRSNCTGVGAASRGANSTPVVSRMPCSIGVIR